MPTVLIWVLILLFFGLLIAIYKVGRSYPDKRTRIDMQFGTIIKEKDNYILKLEPSKNQQGVGITPYYYTVPQRVYKQQKNPEKTILEHYQLQENTMIEVLINKESDKNDSEGLYTIIDPRF